MTRSALFRLAAFAAATALAFPSRFGPSWPVSGEWRVGFLVFAFWGALGEALARPPDARPRPARLAFSVLAWGLYGLGAAFFFRFFNAAASLGQAVGLLPGGGYPVSGDFGSLLTSSFFSEPFFTAVLVSFCYTQPFLALYRLAGAALDLRLAEGRRPGWERASAAADWPAFFRSEILLWPFFRAMGLAFIFMFFQSFMWLGLAAWLLAFMALLSGFSRRLRPSRA